MVGTCVKKTYFSESTANKVIERIKKRAKKNKYNKRYKIKRAYKCPNCGFYHLTSAEN